MPDKKRTTGASKPAKAAAPKATAKAARPAPDNAKPATPRRAAKEPARAARPAGKPAPSKPTIAKSAVGKSAVGKSGTKAPVKPATAKTGAKPGANLAKGAVSKAPQKPPALKTATAKPLAATPAPASKAAAKSPSPRPPAPKPAPVKADAAPQKPTAKQTPAAKSAAPASKTGKSAPAPLQAPQAAMAEAVVDKEPPAPAVRAMAASKFAQPAPRPAPAPTPQVLSAPKPAAQPDIVGDLKPVPPSKAKSPAPASIDPGNLILVGAVAGAFGVQGEVRLRAFTAERDGVISYGPLYDARGKILLRPKSWREIKDGVAVLAPEVKSREEAEALRGQRLHVPRGSLPAPPEDEFYIVDLLGCRAEALDGVLIGEIVAVWNFGAGDILEVKPPNGGPHTRISFTKEVVPVVDLPGRRVVIDPPAEDAAAN